GARTVRCAHGRVKRTGAPFRGAVRVSGSRPPRGSGVVSNGASGPRALAATSTRWRALRLGFEDARPTSHALPVGAPCGVGRRSRHHQRRRARPLPPGGHAASPSVLGASSAGVALDARVVARGDRWPSVRPRAGADHGDRPYHRAMPFAVRRLALLAILATTLAACGSSAPATPSGPPSPGTVAAPREVNLITKDDVFLPDALVLFPGETVLLHVINGGLEVHEAVIGGPGVQAAWEVAEAAVADAPARPTPGGP